MTSPATDWISYHKWNRRDVRMAELWARDLVAYLRGRPWLGPDAAVLDYGCGYFDVGGGLADRVRRADGYDPDEGSLAVARGRGVGPGTTLYSDPADLPRGAYDLIVVNSVIQYLDGDAEMARTLGRFRELLRPRGRVLVGDVVPPRFSSARDALRSLAVAARDGTLVSMLVYLWKAATKGRGLRLYQPAPDHLAGLAAAGGFGFELLPANVTRSRRRYSCVLARR